MSPSPPEHTVTTSSNSAGNGSGGDRDGGDESPTAAVVLGPGRHGDRRNVYVRCDSSGPFEMPLPPPSAKERPPAKRMDSTRTDDFQDCIVAEEEEGAAAAPAANASSGTDSSRRLSRRLSAEEINQQLNLNLGLPRPFHDLLLNSPLLRRINRLLSSILSHFEHHAFALWDSLPLRLRQQITKLGWTIYFPLHKLLLGRRTGIHPDVSYEYHALTTIMWWGRLFPVTVQRMRFSLSQLGVWHPPEAYPRCLRRYGHEEHDESESRSRIGRDEQPQPHDAVVKTIRYDMADTCKLTKGIAQSSQSSVVTGYYVQQDPQEPSEKVLFWLYGGAYLAGDSKGNINLAEKIGQRCSDMDVFLPDYRLLPEFTFHDSLHDVLQAYEYLIAVRGVKPENVTLLGVSSGGGLVVRLLQTLAERRREEGLEEGLDGIDGRGGDSEKAAAPDSGVPKSSDRMRLERLLSNPAGGVLMCPFVDYTEPTGSFREYVAHDLIVNQAVFEEGIPYLATLGDSAARRRESPVHRSFHGLPPLCVVVSEHECCYDQCELLVNNARRDGVKVVFGVWRYVCHVFPMLSMFIPEGRQAIDFMVDWIRRVAVDQ